MCVRNTFAQLAAAATAA